MQTRFRKAKTEFSVKKFFSVEWMALAGTLLTIVAIIYVWDEIIGLRPELQKIVKLLFMFIGFTGSSIALAMFSRTAKFINGIIEVKSEVAEGKVEAKE